MKRNTVVRGELEQLVREGLLDMETQRQLAALYPVARWDWRSLGRWFLIFGAITAAAGAVILLREVFEPSLWHLAVLLALFAPGMFFTGWRLRKRSWSWSSRAAELLGGFALIGLSFVLAKIYSTGSGNWPALLLIDLLVLLGTSYALNNILLLTLSAVVFFCWFGGATGYSSAWGEYWFGMNYPLRFLGASAIIAFVGFLHLKAEKGWLGAYRGFSKVWISSGLFLMEMALWLLSISGNFDTSAWGDAGAGELLFFNSAWAGLNFAVVRLGIRHSYRMLRGYGATFLLIQLYTLFFTRIAAYVGAVGSLIIAGSAALGIALWLEKRRRLREGEVDS